MKPIPHVAVSTVVSIAVAIYFKSTICGVSSFLAGVLIDLDHLYDYYREHGFTLNPMAVYRGCVEMDLTRIYLFLHSYELLTILWISISVFSLSKLWIAFAIGVTQHLIFDQIFNPIDKCGYFLSYRIAKGFDITKILTKGR